MIIAIDGTSGSGKSTIAKKLAKNLEFGFFSAGALYRAITYKILDLHISENEDDKIKYVIENTNIVYKFNGSDNEMYVDGINITEKLHTEEVSNFVSKISCKLYVREYVRKLQRETPNYNENIVMEGRDIGSVIFPNADLKIFVDCKIETRAKRRMADFLKLGEDIDIEKVVEELKERDYRDMHREVSPLVMSENSFLLDTSFNDVNTCLNQIYEEMLRRNLVDDKFFLDRGIKLNTPKE